jgi:membrane protein implicated in regulation of membrane protease activity
MDDDEYAPFILSIFALGLLFFSPVGHFILKALLAVVGMAVLLSKMFPTEAAVLVGAGVLVYLWMRWVDRDRSPNPPEARSWPEPKPKPEPQHVAALRALRNLSDAR